MSLRQHSLHCHAHSKAPSKRSPFNAIIRRRSWFLQVTMLPWILMLLLRPVLSVTLPVIMPASHPKHLLSVIRSQPPTNTHSSLPSRAVPLFIKEVREEEVMYHFYKNGRVGSSYHRKASLVFMVDLFNDLVRGQRPYLAALSPHPRDNTQQEDAPFTDTIRSFSAAEVTFSKKKKAIVHFSMPFLPPNERLRSAEIRFLRHPTARKRRKARYKLSLAVIRGGHVVQKMIRHEKATIQRGYHVFDVSDMLQTWINSFHGNITFQMRIPHKLKNSILMNNASLMSNSLIALYLEDRDFLRNMYQSYTTDGQQTTDRGSQKSDANQTGNNNTAKSRQKRDTIAKGKPRRKLKNRNNKRWYRASKQKCQMYNFKVDFDFIGWGQWIIHPKDFNARFCYGECPSPVDSKYKPTNHAMLQTLMRQKKRRLAPPTCCVPISLRPLSMLYFEYEEIVVRHHEDMIADECGCR